MSHRVTLVDLLELDMLDFDVILDMDYLHACSPLINFFNTTKLDFNSQISLF